MKLATPSVNTKNCFHCGNTIESDLVIGSLKGEDREFCCEGCKVVATIIHETGNEYFYSIKGNQKTERVDFRDSGSDENLDSDYIKNKYFTKIEQNRYQVFIKVTNIHCSACIWLNERALLSLEGVKKAELNFASGRARVEFNPDEVKLSDIFEMIRSIGYKPVLYLPGEKNSEKQNNLKSLFFKMALAGFCFGNIMLFSVSLYAGYFSGIEVEFKKLLHYVSWALATPAYLYSGSPFMKGALASIRRKTLTMDLLLFTGISLAYFYSVYVTITDRGEVYFDSVCMIYFFILIGKFFEERARVRASEEIENLTCKLPDVVIQVDESGVENSISSEEVLAGKVIKGLPGNRIPVDGELISEEAHLDESILTGESKPVKKKKGMTLLAGSIVLENSIFYLTKTSYSDSSLASMKNRLENALLEKPKIQILTERIANLFIQIVFGLSILTFFGWWLGTGDIERALIYTISVLIVACPCALGISVPTALVMNHIINSKSGIILRNPNAIEPLSKLDVVLFDKTGTLTEGKFKIIEEKIFLEDVLPMVYLVEKESRHPLAISLVKELMEKYKFSKSVLEAIQVHSVKTFPGSGMLAELEKKGNHFQLALGSKEFISGYSKDVESFDQNQNAAFVHLSLNGQYVGYFALGDKIRRESLDLIQYIQKNISNVQILSGDNENAVKEVALSLGISNYKANCKPEDKMAITRRLQEKGNIVAIAGDGINDALSLATADVGISHSNAEDISIDKSDMVIVSQNLLGIYQSISNAKLTRRVIKQNIFLSLCYNTIMLPLAMSGNMLPVICAGFMTLSSLSVLVNSVSIRWRKEDVC
jgi:P-type Cu+ transporter